jgi:hypothetical protein
MFEMYRWEKPSYADPIAEKAVTCFYSCKKLKTTPKYLALLNKNIAFYE